MATTSYFQRFARLPTTGRSSQRTQTPTQPTSQYQSTSSYPASAGMQAPGQYQQTPAPNPYPVQPQQPIPAKLQQQIQQQQARMGASASQFAPNTLVKAGDLDWAQFNSQFRTQQQSEFDRQKAYEEMQRAWFGIGQSPESLEAKRAAMAAVSGGGPWTTQLLEQGRGAIRNLGGVGLQSAQRNMAEELARRGMGGSSLFGQQQAQLSQQAALNIQQQLAQFELQAAQQNEAARQAALAQLSDLSGAEQAQRLGIDEAIWRLYKDTQRTPLDFSPLAEQIKKPGRTV